MLLSIKTSSLNFPKIYLWVVCILSGNKENWLQVNSRTGQIKVAKPIDFKTSPDSTLHGGNVKK